VVLTDEDDTDVVPTDEDDVRGIDAGIDADDVRGIVAGNVPEAGSASAMAMCSARF